MNQSDSERRRATRLPIVRPSKVYDPVGKRYLGGLTLNVSDTGLLMTAKGGDYLPVGTPIEVAVDWQLDAGVIRREQMIEARVVRREGRYAGASILAIAYAKRREMAKAA